MFQAMTNETPMQQNEAGFPTAEAVVPEAGMEPSAPHAGVPAEPETSAVARLEAELADAKDRYVRLAAEFDNYKKRVARERAELADRAQAQLLGRFLDALDDVQRILASDAAATPADVLREGIAAVDRKFWKELQAAGLERLDPVGAAFDPALHEAVSMLPAPEGVADHTVSATFQAGYRFRGVLVRPARVQVYQGS